MLGTYFTFPELLIWLPLLAGVLCFFLRKGNAAKNVAIFASILTFAISIYSLLYTEDKFATYNNVSYYWMKYIGATFYVGLDGTSRILTLLTAIAFPIIFIAGYQNKINNPASFFGLMLLTQSGIMGVFCSMDALLFYFFWELAIIPVYFLCSIWGGEKRIKTTFKFFVYTFTGSLLMLTGIIYVYLHTTGRTFDDGTYSQHSFAFASFFNTSLKASQQNWLFWLFFVAFAIKMPVFPFHTWQPDTYDQSPYSVTMVLSGLMVKMGLFAVIRWLIPLFPLATVHFSHIVMLLCIIGILYASCIAIVQDNLKKMLAYSSIAHIGVMCAAIFAMNTLSVQGALIQMFNHGINIIGLWIIFDLLERKTGSKSISQLGGVAQKAPALTIFTVIIALANIALPLTNAFVGEFMMFGGIFKFNAWYSFAAIISIILAAVYMLNMLQKVFYGNTSTLTQNMSDISTNEIIILSVIVVLIFMVGIYPQPMIELTKEAAQGLVKYVTTLR